MAKRPSKPRQLPPPQPFSTQLRDVLRQVAVLATTSEGRELLKRTRIVLQIPQLPEDRGEL